MLPSIGQDGNKEGQGWAMSKFHGVTKFVLYLKLFGNTINFYGGMIGQCNQKKFVRKTGCNTQKCLRPTGPIYAVGPYTLEKEKNGCMCFVY
jgi:hypothetical protein